MSHIKNQWAVMPDSDSFAHAIEFELKSCERSKSYLLHYMAQPFAETGELCIYEVWGTKE